LSSVGRCRTRAQKPDEAIPDGESTEDKASRLEAYDLDGDGHVGLVEDARATHGVIDARLEQMANEGGEEGKIADAAHHLADRLHKACW
jgi:hypothetical protein